MKNIPYSKEQLMRANMKLMEKNKRYREALENTQNAILQNLQKWNYKDEVKLYEAYKHNEKALEGKDEE